MRPALALERLEVSYETRGGPQRVLNAVSLAVAAGAAYGLVGESGSGKTTLALAALGLLAKTGRITAGRALVGGVDVADLDGEGLRRLRAHTVSMVFQDPGKALTPSLTIGRQIMEAYEVLGVTGRAAREKARTLLARVRMAPERVLGSYPHQLSGGMQQRVLIAIALAKRPALLVLDEPTTGLDATVEADVLDLVQDLRRQSGTAVLLISHNLGVVERVCERVGVLYAGRLIEEGPTRAVFAAPRHPYTRGLLRALPAADRGKNAGELETIEGFPPGPGERVSGCVFAPRCPLAQPLCRNVPPPRMVLDGHFSLCHYVERIADGAPSPARSDAVPEPPAIASARPARAVLEVAHLAKTYRVRGAAISALADVSLRLENGETLGLIGESGSGKTTLAKIVVGLVAADRGGITLDRSTLAPAARRRTRAARRAIQIVFQNPDSALNPAHTVARLIGRALRRLGDFRGAAQRRRLADLLDAVRLEARYLTARPRELSGGLAQRVAIARAFAGDPRVVLCDEPTSALDISVQAAVLNLLVRLQREHGTSYLFISHDLAVVRYLADRVAVLYRGHVVETGPVGAVFRAPNHPYTEALLSAHPAFARGPRIRLPETTSAEPSTRGCIFQDRCPRKLGPICETEEPPLRADGEHLIRCHIPLDELARLQARAPPER